MKTPEDIETDHISHTVGVVCFKDDCVLMIQRGKAPRKGEWSIPGGHIETGESQKDAALRELWEETSITAKLGPKIATIPACFEGKNYVLHDYMATWLSGTPKAGDDAADCAFIPITKIPDMALWDKTRELILSAYNTHKNIDLDGITS